MSVVDGNVVVRKRRFYRKFDKLVLLVFMLLVHVFIDIHFSVV